MYIPVITILFLKIRINNFAYGGEIPEGTCRNYFLGGIAHIHYYICCNNCKTVANSTFTDYCDGKTYHAGSTEKYCGTCGKKKGKQPIME
uniref:Uncharacterized protein n=1 Tax=Romanomermis culicivorax TaxID=13658 RepID=A0A915K160_ROMCU